MPKSPDLPPNPFGKELFKKTVEIKPNYEKKLEKLENLEYFEKPGFNVPPEPLGTFEPYGEITPHEKPEKRFEQKKLEDFSRMAVKGSVAYALLAGKDLSLARDVDFFLIKKGREQKMVARNFSNAEELQRGLSPDVRARIEEFLAMHNIHDKPIQVVQTTEGFLEQASLFMEEPEVVLWDDVLEVESELLQPISVEVKRKLEQKLRNMRSGSGAYEYERITMQIEGAYRLHRYKTGELYEGRIPSFLMPPEGRLSAALRLIDLGERFNVEVDDFQLRITEEELKRGGGRIRILASTEAKEIEEGAYGSVEIERSGAVDTAFLYVARRKYLGELLAQRYPNLAALTQRIESAGGIRKFIKNQYGEVYLANDYLELDSPSLAHSKIPVEEQRKMLEIWKNSERLTNLFDDNFGVFAEHYEQFCLTSTTPAMSESEVARRLVKRRAESFLDSDDINSRKRGYEGLKLFTDFLGDEGSLESNKEYAAVKEKLKDSLFREKSGKLKKLLSEILVSLAEDGEDLTIAHDFAEIIKKESQMVRRGKAERQRTLSREGINILRALLAMQNSDANAALFELVANPNLNPRMKKLCLYHLYVHQYFDDITSELVADDLGFGLAKKERKNIPWDDYNMLWKVDKIASSTIRKRIKDLSSRAFRIIRKKGESVATAHQSMAPRLPAELFLPLHCLSGGNKEQIQSWEKVIAGIKSAKLQESFMYNISRLNSALFPLITQKIISAAEITREHILLANRLLKKISFLDEFESMKSMRRKEPVRAGASVVDLLEQASAPSVLEAKFDERMVASLCEMTGRGDLTASKIYAIIQSWEDPEPLFTYVREVAVRSRSGGEEFGSRTLQLTGEMLAHIDPPTLDEWKQWRYDLENPLVAKQLEGFSPEKIKAYSEDELVDLGEVLVGLLPSDKPQRIQDRIMHGARHNWQESATALEHPGLRLMRKLLIDIDGGSAASGPEIFKRGREAIDSDVQLVSQWLNLSDEERLLSGLPAVLDNWQRVEVEKKRHLAALGYGGDETHEEIQDIVKNLKKSRADASIISALTTLQPNPRPLKAEGLLKRYGLGMAASSHDIEVVTAMVQGRIETLEQQDSFSELKQEFFGEKEVNFKDWEGAIKDMKAAQLFMQLGLLTPQLIAFNRISPEKKKASLQNSLDYLKTHFKPYEAVLKTIKDINDIISESSHPIGKDHLAVIFTDNPLTALTIGRFPAGAESCQHYNNGDINLAAYTADAACKMTILVDLDKLPLEIKLELEQANDTESKLRIFQNNTLSFLNASVARRVVKVVHDAESGRPQLFLEPVYTQLNRESITRLLNAFAVTHLRPKIGIDLVRGGGNGTVTVAESRNSYQYEDGETGGPGGGGTGLGTKQGTYRMSAQPITEKDYLVK